MANRKSLTIVGGSLNEKRLQVDEKPKPESDYVIIRMTDTQAPMKEVQMTMKLDDAEMLARFILSQIQTQ